LRNFLETLENEKSRPSLENHDPSKNISFDCHDGLKETTLFRINVRKDEIMYLETKRSLVGIISIFINSGNPFPRAD
jgi:hypothetical protein